MNALTHPTAELARQRQRAETLALKEEVARRRIVDEQQRAAHGASKWQA